MRQLVAGNWKMYGLSSSLREIETVREGLLSCGTAADPLLCVPATLITRAVAAAGNAVAIGAEDCATEASGAFTGDVSAEMLRDAGASAVIAGHSERRIGHGETNGDVSRKAAAAHRAGLLAIICIGESGAERRAGSAAAICRRQLDESVPKDATAKDTAIAYEPIWAIGSGCTPALDEITAMHAGIRQSLVNRLGKAGQNMRILYGGSVNPLNAGAILALPVVDGALIGTASLKGPDYLSILSAAAPRP